MSNDPVLIDLNCGAGGASFGYHLAGFEVVGVDHVAQPHYPFRFHQGDSLELLPELIQQYKPVAIAASPICQPHSSLRRVNREQGHVDQIPAYRAALEATGLPYVMENVVGAPLIEPLLLCGSMFDRQAVANDGQILYLRRHRLFESNLPLAAPGPCNKCFRANTAQGRTAGVYGGSGGAGRTLYGRKKRGQSTAAESKALMGTYWMTAAETSQAVPPAYTSWIGQQIWNYLYPGEREYLEV